MFCFVKDCKLSCKFKKSQKKEAYLSTFIKFPKEEALFKKWLKALGVQNHSAIKWHDRMYLCSGHFRDEDYIEKQIGDNKMIIQLKKDSLPTYLPLPPNYRPKNKSPMKTQSAILETALKKPLNVNKSPEKTNGQTSSQPTVPTNDVIDNAIKKFFEGGKNPEGSNTDTPKPFRRYFQPRYIKDVQLSDLESPRKAKTCLNIATRTLAKQTRRIRLLKNKNRLLYKKLDKLQQILNYTTRVDKQKPGQQGGGDGRETITVLVNI